MGAIGMKGCPLGLEDGMPQCAQAQFRKSSGYAYIDTLMTCGSKINFNDVADCSGAVCPQDICPDGNGRRQVGSDCCSCESPASAGKGSSKEKAAKKRADAETKVEEKAKLQRVK